LEKINLKKKNSFICLLGKKKSKIFPNFLVQKATFKLFKKSLFVSLSHLICKEPVVGPYGHREEGKSFGSP
jgi:hypothetical protein